MSLSLPPSLSISLTQLTSLKLSTSSRLIPLTEKALIPAGALAIKYRFELCSLQCSQLCIASQLAM
jgi:hypothetical protein